MATHTPGPWTVGCEHGLQKLEIANADYSKVVATVWAKQTISRREDGRSIVVADPEGEANCCLIAAAPDLLAALRALRTANGGDDFTGWHDSFHDAIKLARAALTKCGAI